MKYKIKVTQKDINNGVPLACSDCPISLALYRFYNNTRHIDVGDFCVSIHDGVRIERYKLPRSAIRFIRRFDCGRPVKPFNFILDTDNKY